VEFISQGKEAAEFSPSFFLFISFFLFFLSLSFLSSSFLLPSLPLSQK
jgi:hypothetical protein